MTNQGQGEKKGRLRQFWSERWGLLLLALFFVALALVVVALVWTGRLKTGFGDYLGTVAEPDDRAKTLWDWMGLLFVPIILAIGAAVFTWVSDRRQRKAEERRTETERQIEEKRAQDGRDIQSDRAREAALQTYLDRMTELIEKGLVESEPDDPKRSIARSRTLTVLRQLDGERKGLLLRFLHESELIGEWRAPAAEPKNPIIDLRKADLSKANLFGADLSGADLNWADLSGADLRGANLSGVNLGCANLNRAYLNPAYLGGAYLTEADLTDADLTDAAITDEQLAQAKTLEGATMPDGTVHD